MQEQFQLKAGSDTTLAISPSPKHLQRHNELHTQPWLGPLSPLPTALGVCVEVLVFEGPSTVAPDATGTGLTGACVSVTTAGAGDVLAENQEPGGHLRGVDDQRKLSRKLSRRQGRNVRRKVATGACTGHRMVPLEGARRSDVRGVRAGRKEPSAEKELQAEPGPSPPRRMPKQRLHKKAALPLPNPHRGATSPVLRRLSSAGGCHLRDVMEEVQRTSRREELEEQREAI